MLRRVVACASVAMAAENATCRRDRPTLVWLPSSPYSGSHLSRRLLEAALGLCTYAIYPEGVATTLFGGKVLDPFMAGSLSASVDNARARKARGWEPCATPDCPPDPRPSPRDRDDGGAPFGAS